MNKIIWTTTTIGKGKPYYTASCGKFDAKVYDSGGCCTLQVFYEAKTTKMYSCSSIAGCKNQFRKFLKAWGQL
jgi:hypothetical protein